MQVPDSEPVSYTHLDVYKRQEVQSIVIPYGSRWFRPKLIVIPWRGIKKIGRDLIIVDLTTAEDYSAVMKKIQEGRSWNKPPFFG